MKKAKANTAGKALIFLRIAIDGKSYEIIPKRTVQRLKWNSTMQKVSGSSEESKSLNFYIKTFEQKSLGLFSGL